MHRKMIYTKLKELVESVISDKLNSTFNLERINSYQWDVVRN